jgi:hypothetical protein
MNMFFAIDAEVLPASVKFIFVAHSPGLEKNATLK